MAKKRPRKRSGPDWRRWREFGGLALAAAGIFLALVLYPGWSGGLAGGWAQELLRYLFGVMIYLAPPAFIIGGALMIFPDIPRGPRGLRVGFGLLAAAIFLMAGANTFTILGSEPVHAEFFNSDYMSQRGGVTGEALYWATGSLFGDVGSTVVAIFLLLASLFLISGASVRSVLVKSGIGARRAAAKAGHTTRHLGQALAERRQGMSHGAGMAAGGAAAVGADGGPVPFGVEPDAAATGSAWGEGGESVTHGDAEEGTPLNGARSYPDLYGKEGPALTLVEEGEQHEGSGTGSGVAVKTAAVPVQEELFPAGEVEEKEDYILPDPELLRKSGSRVERADDVHGRISRVLVETLATFGVEAKVIGTVDGPRVTRYELQLAPGIKVAAVSKLKDDIAYALATTDIRILAPIPGKSAVGVEVPNPNPNLVTLGDIYRDFPPGSAPLMVWLGKDIDGNPVYADLAQMPHLLVAGTTGSGKSGCINCMVSSVLLRCGPDEVRMILIDPKRVELNHFDGIPHLLTPVVTVMKDAANVLANLIEEMESRYGQMQLVKAKHLDELNRVRQGRGQKPLPYILLVADELADLMMVSPAEVEDAIIRLAQKSRAVGIHLVLATQRPSVDVITGMIKANVPSRIAFAVSSQADSRVILDANGAESLLGQGDMLFRPLGSSQLRRVQGAYISEEEIKLLTDRCKAQKTPDFHYELLEGREADGEEKLPADEDELLPEAITMVVTTGTASVSLLQRRLRVGYTRAGRLIDMMEKRGIISGYEGSKPRRVLVGEDDLERILGGGGTTSAAPASAEEAGGEPDATVEDDE